MRVVALAGGTGSAKLIRGLARLGCDLTVVANVGDNVWMHGLYVCPDIDIAAYTLAGLADRERGWGIAGDTFAGLAQLGKLGADTWFRLGDRDLATHILRTAALREGRSLTRVTEDICARLGSGARVLPATDSPLQTMMLTGAGEMNLQEFWVRRGGRPRVTGVRYAGRERAAVTRQVKAAIEAADAVVACPANPVTSIGPILAVKGMEAALAGCPGRTSALSPMVGAAPFSGPAGKLMRATGHLPNSLGVASLYAGFLDALVIDRSDSALRHRVEGLGIRCLLSDTRLDSPDSEVRLAREVLDA
jgi:LPPG:FO 2-phospho-L-lactate transferase